MEYDLTSTYERQLLQNRRTTAIIGISGMAGFTAYLRDTSDPLWGVLVGARVLASLALYAKALLAAEVWWAERRSV